MTTIQLTSALPPLRVGVPANPAWVRALVPANHVGAYMLFRDCVPLYVGRSDYCLQRRLCNHERLSEASHVVWEICGNSSRAFYQEAFWYDQLKHLPTLLNQIHPAKPDGADTACPFCSLDGPAVRAILPEWRSVAEA